VLHRSDIFKKIISDYDEISLVLCYFLIIIAQSRWGVMSIHFNTAAKMGAGAILTGMAVRYLGVSHPVTIAGLTVMGQALAWMPDFVSRCLRAVRKPERPMLTLSTMPKDMLVEVQKHLPRRDIENLALVDKAQIRDKNTYEAT